MSGYSVSSCYTLLACVQAYQYARTDRLELLLYLCHATWCIVRVCNIVLVYALIASGCAQHKIDYLCD